MNSTAASRSIQAQQHARTDAALRAHARRAVRPRTWLTDTSGGRGRPAPSRSSAARCAGAAAEKVRGPEQAGGDTVPPAATSCSHHGCARSTPAGQQHRGERMGSCTTADLRRPAAGRRGGRQRSPAAHCKVRTAERLGVVVGVVVAGDGALVAIRRGVAEDVQRVRVVHEGAQCRPHIGHLQGAHDASEHMQG